MKIPLPQLSQHLTRPLGSLYLVSGDETLLVEEAVQNIRETAEKQGFSERQRLNIDSEEWATFLYTNTHSLSLFSEKKILELDLSDTKLSAANSKILQEFALKPTPHTLVLIRIPKLDSKVEKTIWFQTLEKNSIFVQIWPIAPAQLPTWIIQRAKKLGVQITQPIAELLARFCEGNLLAASQVIEKIKLLNLSSPVDESLLKTLFTDSAHFDVFNLVESALAGNSIRSLRILNHLQAEGIEPTLILWALTHELRLMNTLAQQILQGHTLTTLFSQHRIWEKRQAPIQQFLRRNKPKDCWKLILSAAKVDRLIKGAEAGNKWDALQDLAIAMADRPMLML